MVSIIEGPLVEIIEGQAPGEGMQELVTTRVGRFPFPLPDHSIGNWETRKRCPSICPLCPARRFSLETDCLRKTFAETSVAERPLINLDQHQRAGTWAPRTGVPLKDLAPESRNSPQGARPF